MLDRGYSVHTLYSHIAGNFRGRKLLRIGDDFCREDFCEYEQREKPVDYHGRQRIHIPIPIAGNFQGRKLLRIGENFNFSGENFRK